LKLNNHVTDLPGPPLVQLWTVALSAGSEPISLAETAGCCGLANSREPEGSHQGQELTMPEKKILLIDDDKEVILALNVRLKSKGYKVAAAGDAISAISTARKEKRDLIVLDIGLPGGDGFIVMERLKALYDFARDAAVTKDRALKAAPLPIFRSR
jgi:CheY-like chemotaxis protein